MYLSIIETPKIMRHTFLFLLFTVCSLAQEPLDSLRQNKTQLDGLFTTYLSEKGNLFYESADSKRRWVIFKKDVEASSVSAEWHGWLHHTVLAVPCSEKKIRKSWEKPHLENRTGSELAYHPLGNNRTKKVNYTDYEAWLPYNDK